MLGIDGPTLIVIIFAIMAILACGLSALLSPLHRLPQPAQLMNHRQDAGTPAASTCSSSDAAGAFSQIHDGTDAENCRDNHA